MRYFHFVVTLREAYKRHGTCANCKGFILCTVNAVVPWADPEGVGEGVGQGSGPPLKNHKNIGFLSNAGPDPLKNHKATCT